MSSVLSSYPSITYNCDRISSVCELLDFGKYIVEEKYDGKFSTDSLGL